MGKRINWRTIGRRIEKQTDFALYCVADGALHTASRVLNELAADVLKAAEAKNRALDRLIAEHRAES